MSDWSPCHIPLPGNLMHYTQHSSLPSALSKSETLHTLFAAYNGLQDVCKQIQDKQEDCDKPSELLVFVFGEGNFGKSSLINCLLGRDVAEVSFLPETWRVDMYRSASDWDEEFALVRKAGDATPEKMSIEDARAECQAQSAEAKKFQKEAEGGATRPGQIIEVQWHYHGLDLPENIVLVDTPGFAQFRAGLNEARTETLSSHKGVVCNIAEVYYEFIHRAHVLLWAFKASKLQDRDTRDTFANITRLNKDTIGVITYTDTVPQSQRPELLQKAQELFGHSASRFVPVVCGGKSPEKGLGIPELRRCLDDLNDRAADIKVQELEEFLKFHAVTGVKTLSVLGDTLIHNISRISLFCNAVSDVLLREARKHHQEIINRQSSIKRLSSRLDPHIKDGLQQIMNDMRFAVLDRQQKQQAAVEKFRNSVNLFFDVPGLNTARQDALMRIGRYVSAQAEQIAQSYRMKQAVIEIGGEPTECELHAWITPPDVDFIAISVPPFTVPVPSNNFFDALFTMIFGGQPTEQQVQSTQLAAHKAIGNLMAELPAFVPDYTHKVANAILNSADQAVGSLYPDHNLETLRRQADSVDTDLKILAEMAGIREAAGSKAYRYGTQYRIWSPRDDTRRAAIDLFCEWFAPREAELQAQATAWFDPARVRSLLQSSVHQQCSGYLQQTDAHIVFVESDNQRREPFTMNAALLSIANFDEVAAWMQQITNSLQHERLFDDSMLAEGLLEDFEYIHMAGIGGDFTMKLITACLSNCRSSISNVKFKIETIVLPDEQSSRLRARPPVQDRSLLVASAAGTATVPLGSVFYLNFLHLSLSASPIAQAIVAGIAAAAVLTPATFGINKALLHRKDRRETQQIIVAWENEKEKRRQQGVATLLQTLPDYVADYVATIAQHAWIAAIPSINVKLAQTLAESRTLIKKKPLDYALAGTFGLWLQRH